MKSLMRCSGKFVMIIFILVFTVINISAENNFEVKPDKDLLEKIKDLPENTWMKLPKYKVIGDLKWLSPKADERTRGPFGRSYCNHAFYAPERKRALFGGGGHNVRPINDIWEYDLAANTWICLRGADPAFPRKNRKEWFKKYSTIKNGIPATKSGAPIRMKHQWDQMSYDPSRKLLIYIDSMPRSLTYSVKLAEEGNPFEKGLGLSHEELKKKLGPDGIYAWGFDPVKREWIDPEFIANWKRPGNTIGGRQEAGILEYISDKKTLLFNGWGGSYMRDSTTGKWSKVKGLSKIRAGVGTYNHDMQKLVVIAGSTTRTALFDGKGWQAVVKEGPAKGGDSSCTMHYDPIAKKVLMFTVASKPNLWIFDPIKNDWRDPKPSGDVPAKVRGSSMIVYYDTDRNVLVLYTSRDIYVYRCKQKK